MIRAEIIADSMNPVGNRLTTFILTYPRFIHAEVMTHRLFSRNAASSRAIPMKKFREMASSDPATFETWTQNQPGMKGTIIREDGPAKKLWLSAAKACIQVHEELDKLKVHKQNANRLLEPWLHMTACVSATEWGNFFNQRCHPDAMPEFQVLAFRMLDQYMNSTPEYRIAGQWHAPFKEHVPEGSSIETGLKICTARVARTSYISFDRDFSPEDDIDLHDRMLINGHWSPFEHCAKAMAETRWCGNFRGWTQYRKNFPEECREDFDAEALMAKKPEWIEL